MNKRKEFALAISSITQLGLRVILSFLIWIFIARWVKSAFNLGNYIMLIGIFFGVGSAVISFYDFCKRINNISEKENENEN